MRVFAPFAQPLDYNRLIRSIQIRHKTAFHPKESHGASYLPMPINSAEKALEKGALFISYVSKLAERICETLNGTSYIPPSGGSENSNFIVSC